MLSSPSRSTPVPAFVQPLHGISSRTTSYNVLYRIILPLVPLIRWGADKRLLENWEIDQLGR
jgi:hypothetical protein